MRRIHLRRRYLALLLASVVWAAVFAGGFTCAVYFVEGTAIAYICLLFLPQVASSVAGAATYVAARGKNTTAVGIGAKFAGVTAPLTAFAGALSLCLLDREMPGGWEFVGVFLLVFVLAALVDVLFALVGGIAIDALAQHARAPRR